MLCQDINEILYVKFDGCASVGITFHEIAKVNIIVNGSTDAQMQVLMDGQNKPLCFILQAGATIKLFGLLFHNRPNVLLPTKEFTGQYFKI